MPPCGKGRRCRFLSIIMFCLYIHVGHGDLGAESTEVGYVSCDGSRLFRPSNVEIGVELGHIQLGQATRTNFHRSLRHR